ncbi:MAG: NAD(P)-dependent oxidoreductase [Rhodospirillales bacterium]|nr:NAD(P)-dependent oxidoreductase [Rhodospirillales bacterium]
MAEIAFFGLGRMGTGMAGRLVAAGHRVRIWNRSRERADPLIDAGAVWSDTPAAAAAGASVAFAMLADDVASEAVWRGPDGALPALAPGAFAVECSTISAAHVASLAADARARGLRYVDCPVTGFPTHAAAGTMTLLVGAVQADLDELRPLFGTLAGTIRHFGDVGAGTAYKLMVNLMGAVQIAALAEGIALGRKLGLDDKTVGEALAAGAAASPQVVQNIPRMLAGDWDRDQVFTSTLRHKDAAYGAALVKSSGVAAPLGLAATAWFEAAKALDPDADQSIVLKAILSAS